MKQLDATELQKAAEIMAALGPDALAIIQWLATNDKGQRGPATTVEIITGLARAGTFPLDSVQVESNIQELTRLGILYPYKGRETNMITQDMMLREEATILKAHRHPLALRILQAVWPDLP